jgi:hypothetical protein
MLLFSVHALLLRLGLQRMLPLDLIANPIFWTTQVVSTVSHRGSTCKNRTLPMRADMILFALPDSAAEGLFPKRTTVQTQPPFAPNHAA